MANRFEKNYIYNVAKSLGKSSENHTHNYRQLQMQIKGKQAYKYNYRDKYIAIYRTQLQQISYKKQTKNSKIITRLSQDFNNKKAQKSV